MDVYFEAQQCRLQTYKYKYSILIHLEKVKSQMYKNTHINIHVYKKYQVPYKSTVPSQESIAGTIILALPRSSTDWKGIVIQEV